jgi:hypothetical protein
VITLIIVWAITTISLCAITTIFLTQKILYPL